MTVRRIVTPTRFIQLSTDTKPAEGSGIQVPPGATTLEYDTGRMYITYDHGANWVPKDDTIKGNLKTISVSQLAGGLVAYTANDVISSGSPGTAWAFTAVTRADAAYGYITKAKIQTATTSVTPRLSMFLFNAIPTAGTTTDNIPNLCVGSGDADKYIGKIDWVALETIGTAGYSEAVATPSTYGNLPMAFSCATGADDIYGILVTRDAVTLGTAGTTTISLTIDQY
jgi:hypothetical protein